MPHYFTAEEAANILGSQISRIHNVQEDNSNDAAKPAINNNYIILNNVHNSSLLLRNEDEILKESNCCITEEISYAELRTNSANNNSFLQARVGTTPDISWNSCNNAFDGLLENYLLCNNENVFMSGCDKPANCKQANINLQALPDFSCDYYLLCDGTELISNTLTTNTSNSLLKNGLIDDNIIKRDKSDCSAKITLSNAASDSQTLSNSAYEYILPDNTKLTCDISKTNAFNSLPENTLQDDNNNMPHKSVNFAKITSSKAANDLRTLSDFAYEYMLPDDTELSCGVLKTNAFASLPGNNLQVDNNNMPDKSANFAKVAVFQSTDFACSPNKAELTCHASTSKQLSCAHCEYFRFTPSATIK